MMKKMHNSDGFNKILDDFRFEVIKPYLKSKFILEIGAGNKHMTKKMRDLGFIVDVTDDLQKFKKPEGKNYDILLATNVLEHVPDDVNFVKKMASLGNEKTVFIISVPNANSLNRIGYVDLGILKDTKDLHKGDLAVSHKKMYDMLDLAEVLQTNGLDLITLFTKIHKPMSNDCMLFFPPEKIKEFLNMPTDIYGAEIFAICKLREECLIW